MNEYEVLNMFITKVLELADRGLFLFPVDAANKMPLTKHGFKDATNDKEQLKKWFGDANPKKIGVAVNLRKSGLVCLDIDNGHPSEEDENAGTREAGQLMKMHRDFNLGASDYVEITQSGGFHMFYSAANAELKKKNIMDHIELLVDSVVIAPTNNYTACDKRELYPDIKAAPNWLIREQKSSFREPNGYVMYGRCKNIGLALNALYKPVPEGERHNTLVTITCSFFATGADIDVIQDLVYRAGETMGLSDKEIGDIWAWAVKKVTNQLSEMNENMKQGV